MTYRFIRKAAEELDEAIDYYERQESGLGIRFLLEIEQGIQKILWQPTAWAKASAAARKYRVDPFPFGIIYEIESDQIVIVSIADLRRLPGYWKGRY